MTAFRPPNRMLDVAFYRRRPPWLILSRFGLELQHVEAYTNIHRRTREFYFYYINAADQRYTTYIEYPEDYLADTPQEYVEIHLLESFERLAQEILENREVMAEASRAMEQQRRRVHMQDYWIASYRTPEGFRRPALNERHTTPEKPPATPTIPEIPLKGMRAARKSADAPTPIFVATIRRIRHGS